MESQQKLAKDITACMDLKLESERLLLISCFTFQAELSTISCCFINRQVLNHYGCVELQLNDIEVLKFISNTIIIYVNVIRQFLCVEELPIV